MTQLLAFIGVILIFAGSIYLTKESYGNDIIYYGDQDTLDSFSEWKNKNHKTYKNKEEEQFRYYIYRQNKERIRGGKLRLSHLKYKLGENQFMDLTQEEFKEIYLNYKVEQRSISLSKNLLRQNNDSNKNNISNYLSVDWRQQGVVSQIRDQGKCGACWAFASIGAIESILAIETGELSQLSEQELIDCSFGYDNMGCSGGLINNAFKYAKDYKIQSINVYPFRGFNQKCQNQVQGKSIKGFYEILYVDCYKLENRVSQQPVATAVDAMNWQFYESGIIQDDECSIDINHAVLVVGFDQTSWIIKNSWGTNWGEQGYARLAKGNTCGICEAPSYPVL